MRVNLGKDRATSGRSLRLAPRAPPATCHHLGVIDIDAALASLSLADKCRVVAGATNWRTKAFPDAGIPQLKMSDGPTGVRGEGHGSSGTPGVAVPAGIAPRGELGSRSARSDRRPARYRSASQAGARAARPHREPAPDTDRWADLRVLQRRPRAVGRTRRRLRPRRPGPRRCGDRQALRLQRHRGRPDDGERRRRRATAARAVPAAVRAGGEGRRRLGDHERVQPARRRARCRAPPPAHRHPANRMGVRRVRRLRLVRRPRSGRCCERRTHPGDAGTRPRVRASVRRRGRAGRRHRGDRRRARP